MNNIFDKIASKILNEANYVQMDSQTKRKRLERQATLLAAKEANDPLYFKYVSASKRRRKYRELIQQKYAARGKAKVAEYEARRK